MSEETFPVAPEYKNRWQLAAMMRRTRTTWTEEQLAVVQREWPLGKLSAAEIAKLVGKSRNAVIGKAHRLGLEQPVKIPVREPRVRKSRAKVKVIEMATKPKPGRPVPENYTISGLAPISIMELGDGRCRAPVGHDDKGVVTYCGDFTFRGKTYCEGHCALYYMPNHPRKPSSGWHR